MPFKSEAQRRYMWANHPDIARRWAKKYGTPDNLPYHKKKKNWVKRLKDKVKKHLRDRKRRNA